MALVPGNVQNILVMGKSGAGKQPRIDVLLDVFKLRQLSTGNIFREYLGLADRAKFKGDPAEFYDKKKQAFIPDDVIKRKLKSLSQNIEDVNGVVLGMKAKYFVNSGLFVPDSITNSLFQSYFAKSNYRGMVLDGYPRTLEQFKAKFLVKLAKEKQARLDLMLIVDNDDDKIVKRTVGRRICPKCAKVYHVEYKPPMKGKFCGACSTVEVIQRSDDKEEKIKARLREFHTKTKEAIAFLEKQAKIPLRHISGNLPVFTEEAVRKSVMDALDM